MTKKLISLVCVLSMLLSALSVCGPLSVTVTAEDNVGTGNAVETETVNQVNIACIGDSLTFGVGTYSGYRYYLFEKLYNAGANFMFTGPYKTVTDSRLPSAYTQHAGYSGAVIGPNTVPGARSSYDYLTQYVSTTTDIAIVMLGHNNYFQNVDVADDATITGVYKNFLYRMFAINPNMTVYCTTMINQSNGADPFTNYAEKNSLEGIGLNALMPTIVSDMRKEGYDVRFIDLCALTNLSGDNGDFSGGDGTHPNEQGQEKVASVIYDAIADQVLELNEAGAGSASATITKVNGITVEETALELHVGGYTKRVVASVTPSNAYITTIKYVSSNPDVATVDDRGSVTAVSEGTAIITATTLDGGYTASCTVNVTPDTESEISYYTHMDDRFTTQSMWSGSGLSYIGAANGNSILAYFGEKGTLDINTIKRYWTSDHFRLSFSIDISGSEAKNSSTYVGFSYASIELRLINAGRTIALYYNGEQIGSFTDILEVGSVNYQIRYDEGLIRVIKNNEVIISANLEEALAEKGVFGVYSDCGERYIKIYNLTYDSCDPEPETEFDDSYITNIDFGEYEPVLISPESDDWSKVIFGNETSTYEYEFKEGGVYVEDRDKIDLEYSLENIDLGTGFVLKVTTESFCTLGHYYWNNKYWGGYYVFGVGDMAFVIEAPNNFMQVPTPISLYIYKYVTYNENGSFNTGELVASHYTGISTPWLVNNPEFAKYFNTSYTIMYKDGYISVYNESTGLVVWTLADGTESDKVSFKSSSFENYGSLHIYKPYGGIQEGSQYFSNIELYKSKSETRYGEHEPCQIDGYDNVLDGFEEGQWTFTNDNHGAYAYITSDKVVNVSNNYVLWADYSGETLDLSDGFIFNIRTNISGTYPGYWSDKHYFRIGNFMLEIRQAYVSNPLMLTIYRIETDEDGNETSVTVGSYDTGLMASNGTIAQEVVAITDSLFTFKYENGKMSVTNEALGTIIWQLEDGSHTDRVAYDAECFKDAVVQLHKSWGGTQGTHVLFDCISLYKKTNKVASSTEADEFGIINESPYTFDGTTVSNVTYGTTIYEFLQNINYAGFNNDLSQVSILNPHKNEVASTSTIQFFNGVETETFNISVNRKELEQDILVEGFSYAEWTSAPTIQGDNSSGKATFEETYLSATIRKFKAVHDSVFDCSAGFKYTFTQNYGKVLMHDNGYWEASTSVDAVPPYNTPVYYQIGNLGFTVTRDKENHTIYQLREGASVSDNLSMTQGTLIAECIYDDNGLGTYYDTTYTFSYFDGKFALTTSSAGRVIWTLPDGEEATVLEIDSSNFEEVNLQIATLYGKIVYRNGERAFITDLSLSILKEEYDSGIIPDVLYIKGSSQYTFGNGVIGNVPFGTRPETLISNFITTEFANSSTSFSVTGKENGAVVSGSVLNFFNGLEIEKYTIQVNDFVEDERYIGSSYLNAFVEGEWKMENVYSTSTQTLGISNGALASSNAEAFKAEYLGNNFHLDGDFAFEFTTYLATTEYGSSGYYMKYYGDTAIITLGTMTFEIINASHTTPVMYKLAIDGKYIATYTSDAYATTYGYAPDVYKLLDTSFKIIYEYGYIRIENASGVYDHNGKESSTIEWQLSDGTYARRIAVDASTFASTCIYFEKGFGGYVYNVGMSEHFSNINLRKLNRSDEHELMEQEPAEGETINRRSEYIGCQDSDVKDGFYNIRFVSGLDTLNLSAVGFKISAVYDGGSKEYDVSDVKVYDVIEGVNKFGITETYTAVDEGYKYLFALTIEDIPISVGEIYFYISPYTIRRGVRNYTATYTVVYNNVGEYEFTKAGRYETPFNTETAEAVEDRDAVTYNDTYGWIAVPMISQSLIDLGFKGGEGCQAIINVYTVPGTEIMFMGTDVGGIYKSVDGGDNWYPTGVGLNSAGATGFSSDPINKDRIFCVGTNAGGHPQNGVYLSTDGGDTWTGVLNVSTCGFRDDHTQIAVDPTSYNSELGYCTTVYWARENGTMYNKGNIECKPSIYKSTDGGYTWSVLENTEHLGDSYIYVNEDGFIAVSNSNGTYISRDGGATFTCTLDKYVTSMDYVSTYPNNLYCTTYEGFFVSKDFGTTWEKILSESYAKMVLPTAVRVSPLNPDRIMVLNDSMSLPNIVTSYTFSSSDGGKTWTQATRDTTGTWVPNNSDNMHYTWSWTDEKTVVCNWSYLCKSTDGGVTFKWNNAGYNGLCTGGMTVPNVNNGDLLFTGSQDYNGGYSTDGGATWTYLSWRGVPWGGFVYGGYVIDETTVVGGVAEKSGGSKNIWVYSDGTYTNTGNTINGTPIGCGVVGNNDVVFMGEWRSADKGATWTKMDNCSGVFTVDYSTPGVAFGAKGATLVVTTDYGETWTTVTSFSQSIRDIAYDFNSGKLYVISGYTDYYTDYTLYTVNVDKTTYAVSGETAVSTLSDKGAISVCIDPNHPEIVYVGFGSTYYFNLNSVYRSTDAGETWVNLSRTAGDGRTDPDGARQPRCVRVNPNTGELFVWTSCRGIWKISGPRSIYS